MSVHLTDFTTNQLQVLLNTVVAKVVDLQSKADHLKGICEACEVSYPATDIDKMIEFELETLSLFRVQILNAIAEVDRKEFINSN